MSADSTSDEEQPIVDEEAVSEVIRKPTRTAGDLSEGGEASGGITLEGLIRRVQRIEEHLGIAIRRSPNRLGASLSRRPPCTFLVQQGHRPHRDPAEDLLKGRSVNGAQTSPPRPSLPVSPNAPHAGPNGKVS
jgi:hypothetical protein